MREIFCLDPGIRSAEVDSFNNMVGMSQLPMSYHLPALVGMDSVHERAKRVRLAGVVVLGSAASVHDHRPWQPLLHDWVKATALSGVPILGICYGHQMIAKIFGGDVGFSPYGIFHRGFRSVEFSDAGLFRLTETTGKVTVSHQEVVTRIPQDFDTFVQSKDFASEGIRHKSLPIWSVQFHPEATELFCRGRGISHGPQGDPVDFGHRFVKDFLDFCSKQS